MQDATPGVWATMLTPFTDRGDVDYSGLSKLIEWYLAHDVIGLFTACKSSESFEMSLPERLSVARFTVEKAAHRVPVIAGGNLSETIDDQASEIIKMSDTGVDAVVLLTSTIAPEQEGDPVWRDRVAYLLDRIRDDISLGLYESPTPYHRIVSQDNLLWCLSTGRFLFLKDTSCDQRVIDHKLEATNGSRLRVFNANTQTLLESLRSGAAGYCSVMSNINPELYAWLIRNHRADGDRAERLQHFLSIADAATVARCYPVSAKYYLTLEGLPLSLTTRMKTRFPVDRTMMATMEHLQRVNKEYETSYGT
jgi:4-hydroxy-tetrahydrodipicolinate synthase